MKPIIGILILFLTFSVGSFVYIFCNSNPIDRLSKSLDLFIFAVFFFCFSIYAIVLLLKKSKRYSAMLLSKEIENYDGNKIWSMTFRVYKKAKKENDMVSSEYRCFTYSDNPFVVNQRYDIFLKEVNWVITRVFIAGEQILEVPNSTLKPVFIFIETFLIIIELICLYYLIFSGISITLLLVFFFVLYFIMYVFRYFNAYEEDNKVSSGGDNCVNDVGKLDLPTFCYSSKKVSNLAIKDLLKYAIIFPIIWIIILVIWLGRFSWSYILWALVLSSIPEIFIVFLILYYINYDKRLIKRKKLKQKHCQICLIFLNLMLYFLVVILFQKIL